MAEHSQKPYGTWGSPITSDIVAADSISIGDIVLDGPNTYWTEMRPADDARNVIVRRGSNGTISDITPAGFNVRTRVHEYGGGAFTVSGGAVYFVNYADQRVYYQDALDGTTVEPWTITPHVGARPEDPRYRYEDVRDADFTADRRYDYLIGVREKHSSRRDPENTIWSINLIRHRSYMGGVGILVSGNDFYAAPRISPDERWLAWLSWDHPNMPWDGCELWVAERLDGGGLDEPMLVAGGRDESIFQPEWSPGGVLHFVSDRTGWWNIYRCDNLDPEPSRAVVPVCAMDAEFGRPAWALGMSTYGFASEQRIICAYTQAGVWHIGDIDTETGTLTRVPTPFNDVRALHVSPQHHVIFTAGTPTQPMALMRHSLVNGSTTTLRRTSDTDLDAKYVSQATPVEFPTDGGETAHAFYYPPTNGDCAAPDGERPPMIVISHGGPTSAASASFDLRKQFWTSRGFALLDVNYGGSSGYGTAYRRRLNGQWGVVDVADCVNAAMHMVSQGLADGERLIIRGSSAGGFTTLLALATRDVFRAGASYYGVSDLAALLRDTHKFESRYLDTLVGQFPECEDVYHERSAINHIDSLSAPMIVLQGLEDEIVPPNQAEAMVNALKERGLPVAYLTFEGEQHGFRKAENIQRALDAELYFYGKVFGFEPADGFDDANPPVHIDNLRMESGE